MLSQQQTVLYGTIFLLILLLTLLVARVFMTAYVPLYSALTPNQMVQVIEQLNRDEIDYRIQDQDTISIAQTNLLQERERMASLGITPKEDRFMTFSVVKIEFWIMTLLYSVTAVIGLFFLFNIWSKIRQESFKKDLHIQTIPSEELETVQNSNVLHTPIYNGNKALIEDLERRIQLRKDDVAVLIEALLNQSSQKDTPLTAALETALQEQYQNLSRIEKVAFVLGQLDVKITASILRLIHHSRMREIALVLSKGITVDRKLAKILLEEFVLLIQRNPYVQSGSKPYVKEVLQYVLASDDAHTLLNDIAMMARRTEFFSWLATVRVERIAEEIRREHPQTVALLLAHLDANVTAKVLEYFSDVEARAILKRIATLTTVPLNVIEPLMDGLELKFNHNHIQSCIGGVAYMQKVQQVMKADKNSAMSPHAATEIERLFEAIGHLDDGSIRRLLKRTGKKELMYALKGASEELKEQFLANMSFTVSKRLREMMDKLLHITAKEIHDAQKQILQRVKFLDEE